MQKEELKAKVLLWLSENGIHPKRVRVYNHRRYGWEVRVYGESQEMPNSRKSFRRDHLEGDVWHGYRGTFSRKISFYTAIGEDVFKSPEEMKFTLECVKNTI